MTGPPPVQRRPAVRKHCGRPANWVKTIDSPAPASHQHRGGLASSKSCHCCRVAPRSAGKGGHAVESRTPQSVEDALASKCLNFRSIFAQRPGALHSFPGEHPIWIVKGCAMFFVDSLREPPSPAEVGSPVA